MASSSQHGAGGVASPPAQLGAAEPGSPLAALHATLDKAAVAGVLSRHKRDAGLSRRAVAQAAALQGADSLAVARLRQREVNALSNLACVADGPEKKALVEEAWALLLPVQALLLQRVSANTLLPGGLRQEEMDVFVFLDAAICKAKGGGAVPAHVLSQKKGLFGGYSALVDTVVSTLNLLPLLPWPPAQAESARLFVLDALDVVPHTAGFQGMVAEEPDLVVYIEAMAGRPFDPAFRAAVLRKWMSPAVRNVLLARGVLQRSGALREREEAEFDARRNADIEQIGLRECAFFSCDKVEKTVREFKLCSGCRSVWYCSAEHHWLDWGAHKKRCGELTAAQK